ncbi:hypothetical protein ACKWTF_015222 [Chironomus riparius]
MDILSDPLKLEPKIEESISIITFPTTSPPRSPNPTHTSSKRQPIPQQIEPSPIAIFKCSTCTQTFEFKSQQIIHEMSHKVKSTCQVCSKKIYKGNMKEHMKIHLRNKSYICNFCNEKFATKFLMIFHLRSQHIKSKAYYCNDCGRGFNDSRHYKNHLVTHIDSQPFKCDLCPKGYKRKQLLEFHLIGAHQTERKLQCTICDFETINLQELKKHRNVHLKNFQCEVCQKEFKERRYLALHHEAVHVKERNYQCLICEKDFFAVQYVKRHLKRVHDGDLTKFRCLAPEKMLEKKVAENRVPEQEIVRKSMKNIPLKIPKKNKKPAKASKVMQEDRIEILSRSALETEVEDQMSIDQAQNCESDRNQVDQEHTISDSNGLTGIKIKSEYSIKPEIFDSSDLLVEIKKEYEDPNENSHDNLQYPSSYPQTQSIKQENQQQPTHYKIAPYQPRMSFSSIRYMENQIFTCPTCSNTFPNRSSLLLHEPKCKMRNKDEDNLNCEFCDKKFSDQFTLEVHVNVRHVNVKIHKCRECDFETHQYFEFRNHRMTHMDLVKCEKCSKEFPTERLMLEHAKDAHIGPSEFKCGTCAVGFRSSVFLQRHMKTAHCKLRLKVGSLTCGMGLAHLSSHHKPTNPKPA